MICSVESCYACVFSFCVPVYILYPQGMVLVFLALLCFYILNTSVLQHSAILCHVQCFSNTFKLPCLSDLFSQSLPSFDKPEPKVCGDFPPRLIKIQGNWWIKWCLSPFKSKVQQRKSNTDYVSSLLFLLFLWMLLDVVDAETSEKYCVRSMSWVRDRPTRSMPHRNISAVKQCVCSINTWWMDDSQATVRVLNCPCSPSKAKERGHTFIPPAPCLYVCFPASTFFFQANTDLNFVPNNSLYVYLTWSLL